MSAELPRAWAASRSDSEDSVQSVTWNIRPDVIISDSDDTGSPSILASWHPGISTAAVGHILPAPRLAFAHLTAATASRRRGRKARTHVSSRPSPTPTNPPTNSPTQHDQRITSPLLTGTKRNTWLLGPSLPVSKSPGLTSQASSLESRVLREIKRILHLLLLPPPSVARDTIMTTSYRIASHHVAQTPTTSARIWSPF
ncbi:hypothetical protein G7Z17_g13566 [Cylindrodendrum hubeiense]|uniref:Uncharacterized protein n=1 Tax=Cylindrodendrum hubeiense TaxID=595255 RepID=A0A9P5L9F7_9HYPO|nr:hypothetical protein G7Z17_g13566 [Cylindrodendrum hubeiense]